LFKAVSKVFIDKVESGEKTNLLRLHSEWRLVLFVVCAGTGCAGVISLEKNIAPYLPYILGLCLFSISIMTIFLRRKGWARHYYLTLLPLCLAGIAASLRLFTLDSAYVQRDTYVEVIGVVRNIEVRPERPIRLSIAPHTINNDADNLPAMLRLVSRKSVAPSIRPGEVVRFQAILTKPNGPIVPGGYDFSKAARFQGIGASGFITSDIFIENKVINNNDIHHYINVIRKKLEQQILHYIPGQEGAVAAALLVGFRHNLSLETTEDLRRAGLAHLLAISGLHMGLISGVAFYFFEFLFAAIPAIGLRVLPKKLAVIPTWSVAFFYLLLSGANVSAIRAFIMVTIALLAVLADRKVLSLRSVALAALALMVLWPESVVSIGFQMSFAATAGLVAFYEVWSQRKRLSVSADQTPNLGTVRPGIVMRLVQYVTAIGGTSLIAQASIAPFALYHFHTLSLIGLAANILVLPIISFCVMPLLLLGLFTSSVDGFAFVGWPLYQALEWALAIAAGFSSYENAVLYTGPISDIGFVVAVVSFLGLLVIRVKPIAICLLITLVFSLWAGREKQFDILISETGKGIAEKREGGIYSYGDRKKSFRHQAWSSYWGKSSSVDWHKLKRLCDDDACRYQTLKAITYVKTLDGVRRACFTGDIIILPRRYKRYCKGAALILTQEELAQKGPVGLHLAEEITLEWATN